MACRDVAVPAKSAGVLRISEEKTLQLVQLYAEEDCLWNPNSMGYKNREIRHMAAEKIATILDLPNFTSHHVITKFRNLRNSYSQFESSLSLRESGVKMRGIPASANLQNQELKKIAASAALGDRQEYRPKVLWFETMDSFLRPYLQSSAASLLRDERQNGKYKEDERTQPSPDCLSTGSEDESGTPMLGRKRRRSSQGSLEERSVWHSLHEVQAQLRTLVSGREDHHATFGQHVASLMRALPARRALALQPRLLLLITEELEAARATAAAPPAHPAAPHLHLANTDTTFKIEIDESD